MAKAVLPHADLVRGSEPVVQLFAKMHREVFGDPISPMTAEIQKATLANSTLVGEIVRTLRAFQGDWPKLGLDVERLYDHSVIRPRGIPSEERFGTPTVTVEAPAVVVDPSTTETDWRVEWWRYLAALTAALYFTAMISAQVVFTDPDLLTELRDNAAYAIAIFTAMVAYGKRRGW